MNAWISNWYIFYILAIFITIFLIYMPDDEKGRGSFYLLWLTFFLSLIGFILYIFWLINFNNKNFLQTFWITSLVFIMIINFLTFVVLDYESKLTGVLSVLSYYLTPIFIGALIAFFTKK